ncbi:MULTISPECIES: hypothetical protein [unclassified Gordonia (in: high G+C Gram-positive bacteria)]
MTTNGPTTASTSMPKIIAVVVGTSILLSVMVLLFALPAARSAPHHVPVGVVASEQAQSAVRHGGGDGFEFTSYSDESAARTAIEHREVYGAVLIGPTGDVTTLVASAASPTVATLIQTMGQRVASSTRGTATSHDIRAFPAKDPRGAGLSAGALPLALGGWITAMVIMLVLHTPRARVAAALGVSVIGGLALVALLQFVVGTFDGNYLLTSVAAMLGIAATCFAVLGLRELLGGPGIAIAAVALILLGNPLSGLSSAPEMLPTPWGAVGQLLPPGATGSLLRDVVFFDGHGIAHALTVLLCWLVGGLALYALGVARSRREHTTDVDVIEFDSRRETVEA